ncbi:hypothetical protein [Bacillus sp. FJAT-47783]|uniref:hypothetical protein n=1 Tax=Bacillus sp. FJAT-47783 TaxID=2922712 RepID=UPI001FAC78DA|nr:hypothetical protein [Bacillus sp. FJAT-47783]
MRFSTKHEHAKMKSFNLTGVMKYDHLTEDDGLHTFEISSEFGLHGRDIQKFKQQINRT